MTVKEHEIIHGADHRERHDDDPHCVYDVALDRSVHKDAVPDQIVVVEVAADDRRAEVDDHAAQIHHEDAERDAAETAATFTPNVVLAERVRLAAHHGDDVEPRRRYYDDVGAAEHRAEARSDVAEQARRERHAVQAFDHVEDTLVDDERIRHATERFVHDNTRHNRQVQHEPCRR